MRQDPVRLVHQLDVAIARLGLLLRHREAPDWFFRPGASCTSRFSALAAGAAGLLHHLGVVRVMEDAEVSLAHVHGTTRLASSVPTLRLRLAIDYFRLLDHYSNQGVGGCSGATITSSCSHRPP